MTAHGALLIIGCGNTLRRDDGVGPRVAQAIAALNLPGTRAIARHQLAPELAEPISQASGVIFVDADVNAAGEVRLNKLEPKDGEEVFAHAVDPRSLLALAGQLFGCSPPAWSLAIPVEDFGFGDGLSPRGEAGLQAAIKHVRAHASRFHPIQAASHRS
jgi:hydrogenase maturation protease